MLLIRDATEVSQYEEGLKSCLKFVLKYLKNEQARKNSLQQKLLFVASYY